MYRRTAFVLVVVLLALIQPLKAQDTATISDRQLRQRLDYALSDTRKSIEELNQVLARMQTLRLAVQNRITRDSIAARPSTGNRPSTNTGTSTGGPNSPVNGSNGGPSTPPAAAAVFEDSFEGGAPAATRNGYGWLGYRPATGEGVAVSREAARSGSHSMRFTYAGNPSRCADGSAEQRFTLGENLKEVWIEYYIRFPGEQDGGSKFYHRSPTKSNSDGSCSNTPDVSSNNKFLRLWDVNYNDFDVKAGFEYRRSPSRDGESYLYGMYGSDSRPIGDWGIPTGTWNSAISDATRGKWVHIRVHAKVADSKEAANGVLRLWADGVLRVDMRNLDMAAAPGGNNFFRNGYVMGWSNSGFDQTTHVYIDDFKIFSSNPGWQ